MLQYMNKTNNNDGFMKGNAKLYHYDWHIACETGNNSSKGTLVVLNNKNVKLSSSEN